MGTFQKILVFKDGTLVGHLKKIEKNYVFTYNDKYVSAHLPILGKSLDYKNGETFVNEKLFPLFEMNLPEGINLERACRNLKIDKNDKLSLLAGIGSNCIGGISFAGIANDEQA